ncbi:MULTISPECIES: DUF3016 domain-containing protein [Pseudidiomarina]|uniref:DUF3016 domain-containing protein n=2 Tax=Pseudidiomarina TaxID=2800384 RepID=A0A0K6H3N9_9GAMM|nr:MULTISPECIES: DUF3016 domain-containing protein [Pseudidiomarina]RUO45864.1 DUF3016 domain-containing protein [Pseudidiomarina donghaiensis]CUA85359.1 Protein of unknown function (DUF3016) [Pseudidiomarina woesei]SFV25143.1 Protein of unknown function [Pseudidiomarina donghaiensis]
MNAMKFLVIGVLSVSIGLVSSSAHAAQVTVKWDDVKSFTDIKAVNARQDRFEESVMKALTEHVEKLAEQLPASNSLAVTFNDVDIAGRIEPTFGALASTHQRILDDLSYPELIISFEYLNDQGETISSGEMIELKNLAPMTTRRSTMATGRDNLYYEKQLLDRWFSDTFKQ